MNWKDIIQAEAGKEYYQQLAAFVQQDAQQHVIYPSHSHIFSALKHCPLDKVKVVILGQDPYHGPNQAHGLSFSVPKGTPIPPSLTNIFKELKSDIGMKTPTHGCLIDWAEQGVLLLNTVLTVRQGQAGSHKNKGWETFTDTIIHHVNQLDRPVAHMLWGSFAKSKMELITNSRHLVLQSVHPSPLSAYNGFFGCKHFSQANQFLLDHGVDPIDWSLHE